LGAAGFRLRYLPEAVAVHHWGASTSRSPARMLRHAYLSRVAYFDKHCPGWGGAVAGALASLELAVRTATLGLAARLTGSAAAAGGPARAPLRAPRDRRALPAARGDALPRPGEPRRAGPAGARLVGRAPRAAVERRARARSRHARQAALRAAGGGALVDRPAR